MNRSRRRGYRLTSPPVLLLWVAGGVSVCGGCTPRHQKETAPVTGRVTLDGTPLTSGAVFFVPASGRGATGEIGADGTYRLGTYQPGDGAAVGTHQVAVFPKAPSSEFDDVTTSQQVPARYQAPNTSGIEVEVVAGQTNIHDLKLTTKP